jgi:hypothetical protein
MRVRSLEVELLQVRGKLLSLQRDYDKLYDELVKVRRELWELKK